MSFHHDTPAGKKKILPNEIGKEVRTCTGTKIGTVSAVSGDGTFKVSLSPEGRSYLRADEDTPSVESPSSYLPEDIEMVTGEAVWLRL